MATDRRIKYTKMVLRQALLEILQERPIERVTVKEICDRADINRSTFYVHYGSPQELLDGIQREMFEEIKEKKRDFTNIKAYMADMCDIIYDNRELMQVLLKAGKAEVKVLHSADKWYGVTYAADKPHVVAALREMGAQGKYPDGLWK